MAITSINDIAAGLSVAQYMDYFKAVTAMKAIGSFESSWLAVGNPGAGAASPAYDAGAGYNCDKDTVGAFPYANASVQNYLAKWSHTSVIPGTFILADRLWSCSGMGYGASTYTVTTPGELPARITDYGVGCELWVEMFTTAGVASGTLTCVYRNPANEEETGVLPAVVSSALIGQMIRVPLQGGATGIRSLVSVTNSNSWSSGSWGMTILKRIATIEVITGAIGKTLDWAGCGLPKIPNDACLFYIAQGAATTASQSMGHIAIIDK